MTMTETRTGKGTLITRNEPIRKYHSDRNYLNSGSLKVFAESPMLFDDLINKQQLSDVSTLGLDIGKAWHDIRELRWDAWRKDKVLIPERYTRADGTMSTARAARAWLDNQIAEGLDVISQQHLDTLAKMEERFQMNTQAVLFDDPFDGHVEHEVSIRFEQNDVKQRVRPDITSNGRLGDYKSTRDPNPLNTFYRAVRRYRYDLSAVMYQRGCELAGVAEGPMVFLVTSTVGDCQTQVVELHSSVIERAENEYDHLIETLRLCRENNCWTPNGYGEIGVVGTPWQA